MFTNEKEFLNVTEKVYGNLEKSGATACCVRDTYRHSYRMIHRFLKCQSFGSYSDIYQNFVAIGSSKRQLSRARTAIRELAFFDNGELESVSYVNHRTSKTTTRIACLELEFCELLNEYQAYCKAKEYCESTISNNMYTGLSFFEGMQSNGILKLSELGSEELINFFNDSGMQKRGYAYIKSLRRVLCTPVQSKYSVEKNRLLHMLPEIRYHRKNIQYLSKEEITKIVEILKDPAGILSMKGKAIGLLALLNGLRSSDIRNLSFSNIDWDSDRISIIQKKTGAPLQIPLLPGIGNALFEYITKERSQASTSQKVFITDRFPYNTLSRDGLKRETNKIFLVAGIRIGDHERKGLHLLRHHFAEEMLSLNYPVTTISKALGHKSPTTTQTYLFSGFGNLQECALDVSCFKIEVRNEN